MLDFAYEEAGIDKNFTHKIPDGNRQLFRFADQIDHLIAGASDKVKNGLTVEIIKHSKPRWGEE